MRHLLFLLFTGLVLITTACGPEAGSDDDDPMMVNFDRRAMLTTWSETVISPAYGSFNDQLGSLDLVWEAYLASPNATEFDGFKFEFDEAYRKWQRLSPFLFGKAEEIRLRGQVNTYPANVGLIEENVSDLTSVNLELPSQAAAQGLPALDYIIYGPDAEVRFADENYRTYITLLIDRMQNLTTEALTDWQANAEAFVQNDGNSATASIDRLVNDYIFHYEKFLRAGKVGIPAGVFSDDPLADRAESLYGGNSKFLFEQSLLHSRQFFEDRGLADYLDALNVMRDGALLSTTIKNQFAAIKTAGVGLNDNFATQVTEDNTKMLALYDEMQKLVVLLKVDMLQALSINVDYVDADGD